MVGDAPSTVTAGKAPTRAAGRALRPIRLVLLGLVMGVLAPLLVLVAGYGAWNIHLQREQVDRGLRERAWAVSLHVDQDVQAVQAALRTLALSPYLRDGDLAAFYPQAVQAAAPFGGWIVVGSRSQQQVLNTLVPHGEPLPVMNEPEISLKIMETGEPAVSGLFVGGVAKRPIVVISVPVLREDRVIYELRMAFFPERFAPLVVGGGPDGWMSLLLDANHDIITQSPDDGREGRALGLAIRDPLERVAAPGAGIIDRVSVAGRQHVVSYTRSETTGWLTVVAAPVGVVNDPVTRATLILAGGAVISLLLAILAALMIGRRIALPLQTLARQADGIIRGEIVAAGPQPVHEVADLRRALDEASEVYRRQIETRLSLERETRARELAEYSRAEMERRERKTRRLIESNLIGVVIADEWRILEANAVFLGMMGYNPEELRPAQTPPSSSPLRERSGWQGRGLHDVQCPPLLEDEGLAGLRLEEPLLDADAMRRLRDDGEIPAFETELLRRDGRRIPVLVGAARIETQSPDQLCWVCFVVDLTQQRQAASDLRRSEERYRGLVEAISSIVWTADARGTIVDMQHWSDLTGQAPERSLGRGWLDALHPEDRAPTLASWSYAIDNRMPLDIEYRVRNRNGRFRWYHARGAPVLDADGSVREWVGVCFDIDERKAAASRQLLLMAELDHRVRNILSTIQSMISLTGNSAATKAEYAALLQGRVTAMARTHGLLSRETWYGATLMQIVRDEVAPYTADPDVIVIDGDSDFTLQPKDALDFALVIHELMTNAAKYGALSNRGGRLHIVWHVDPHTGLLNFNWREMGGPPVQPCTRRGFGTRLIESVFNPGLGRSADCCFLPDGVSCTLTMPTRLSLQRSRAGNEGAAAAATGVREVAGPMPEGRILIVEDEPLIAMELHRLVAQAGLDVSGPAGTLDQALILALDETLTGAVLDINLGVETSYAVADRLINNGVPVIFVTGYTAETVPDRFGDIPVLQKPVDPHALLAALRRELAGGRDEERGEKTPAPRRARQR